MESLLLSQKVTLPIKFFLFFTSIFILRLDFDVCSGFMVLSTYIFFLTWEPFCVQCPKSYYVIVLSTDALSFKLFSPSFMLILFILFFFFSAFLASSIPVDILFHNSTSLIMFRICCVYFYPIFIIIIIQNKSCFSGFYFAVYPYSTFFSSRFYCSVLVNLFKCFIKKEHLPTYNLFPSKYILLL